MSEDGDRDCCELCCDFSFGICFSVLLCPCSMLPFCLFRMTGNEYFLDKGMIAPISWICGYPDTHTSVKQFITREKTVMRMSKRADRTRQMVPETMHREQMPGQVAASLPDDPLNEDDLPMAIFVSQMEYEASMKGNNHAGMI